MMNTKYQTRKNALTKKSQKFPRGLSTLYVPLVENFATTSEVSVSTFPWQSNEREQKANEQTKNTFV